MRVALNQSCLPGISTAEFVAIAADCGAEAVELRLQGAQEDASTMGRAARAGGLPVASVSALMDWALPDDPDPSEQLDALLEVASAAKCHVVVCVGPICGNPLSIPKDMISVATERLGGLVQRARGAGVLLALEQVGRSSSRPNATSGLRSLQDVIAVVNGVGAGAALCADSYNLATAGVPYTELAVVSADKIAIAQLADRDPASPWRALPGDGDLDLVPFVTALALCNYAGALSVETFPQRPWADPRAVASRAVSATRMLLGSVPHQ